MRSSPPARQSSARRDHLLASLREASGAIEHPLLDLGGSRSVARSPTHLMAASRGSTIVANVDPAADPDVVLDAHALPFADGSFQTVVLAETLEHLRAPVTAVAEIHRVLRPGGRLILTVPFAFRVHGDPHDFQRFTADGLRVLLAEFEIERVETHGGPWSVISCIVRDLLYGARPRWMPTPVRDFIVRGLPRLAARDRNARVLRSRMLAGWTTGYLVIARRQ